MKKGFGSLELKVRIEWQKFQTNERLHKRIGTALIFVYLYLQFELASFFAVSFMLIGLNALVKLELKVWKQKGLIHYLPANIANLLTNSSIFDLFKIVWTPNLFLYLKTFYKPFFLSISPDEAVRSLEDLPENARNVILTKGIVYSLPRCFRSVLLPLQVSTELAKREDELTAEQEMLAIEDNRATDLTEGESNQSTWGVQKDHELKRDPQKRILKQKQQQLALPSVVESEGELEKFGRKSGFLYSPLVLKDENFFNYESRLDRSRVGGALLSVQKEFAPRKKTLEGSIPAIKTKVIASSSDLVEQKAKGASADERMVSFFEGIKQQLNSASGDSTLGQIKNAINLLAGVAEIKKKTNLMTNFESKRIYKLFMLSSVFLLSQYFISKKTRRWVISSSMFAAYIVSFFLTFGSLGLFIYKQSNQYPQILDKNAALTPPPQTSGGTSKKPQRRREQTFQEDSQFD